MVNLLSKIFGRKKQSVEVSVEEANRFLLQNGLDIYSAGFPAFHKAYPHATDISPLDRYVAWFSDLRAEPVDKGNHTFGTKVSGVYHNYANANHKEKDTWMPGATNHYRFEAIDGKLTFLDDRR